MMMSASCDPCDVSAFPSGSIMASCVPRFRRLAILDLPGNRQRRGRQPRPLTIAKSVVTLFRSESISYCPVIHPLMPVWSSGFSLTANCEPPVPAIMPKLTVL